MTLAEMRKNARESSAMAHVHMAETLRDLLLDVLNTPGPDAAALRAMCARTVIDLMQELVDGVTG